MTTVSKLIRLGIRRDKRLLKIAYTLNRLDKKEDKAIWDDNLRTDNEMIRRFYSL